MALRLAMSVCRSNTLEISIGWIVMNVFYRYSRSGEVSEHLLDGLAKKKRKGIHGLQMMYPNDFGDLLTFPLARFGYM